MKTALLIITLSAVSCFGFAPRPLVSTRTRTATTLIKNSKLEEISHELEELGEEIRPQLLHEPHGFKDDFHDSLVHKLRHAMHEKDALYHKALNELEKRERNQTTMATLQYTLEHLQRTLHQSIKEVAPGKQGHENTLKELRDTLMRIEKELTMSRAFAVAWETAEVQLYGEKTKHTEERESLRGLLWQAAKLSARRIKRGVLRIVTLGQYV